MSKLALLDHAFIKLEEGGMSPAYMGGAMILDPAASPYPMDGKMLGDHLAACMEEIPLMRQKLVQDPLKIGDMRLVDDPEFDVRNHITYSTLAAPGAYAELTACLGVFSAQRMDLTRPLWHYEVIDGLADGKIAVATHLHHSVLDGVGATKVMAAMWALKSAPARKPMSGAWQMEKQPTQFQLMSGALMENAQRLYIKAPVFALKNAAPALRTVVEQIVKKSNLAKEPEKATRSTAPKVKRTSLNVGTLSAQRSVAYLELPLKAVKALAKQHNCSINDLVLLFNSFALQHYFEEVAENINFDLVAAMPINLRAEDDDTAGNAMTAARVNLHNTIANADQRLAAISEDVAAIKKSIKPIKTDKQNRSSIDYKALSALFSPIVLDALFFGVVKFNLLEKATLVNVLITNVPGSPVPLYLAGAKLVSMIPMAPCVDSMALTITISSTEELLILGYHGCGETIKDKELLVVGARSAFESLSDASKPKRRQATKQTGTKIRTRAKATPKAKPGRTSS